MGRPKKIATETADPSAALSAPDAKPGKPARRGRPRKPKTAGRNAGKTVVLLPKETIDLVRDVAERLERPVVWVVNRIILNSTATLCSVSGTDFLTAADAAGLR